MASHSSTLAWKILWKEEPGKLQSMGLQRVAQDCAISLLRPGLRRSWLCFYYLHIEDRKPAKCGVNQVQT